MALNELQSRVDEQAKELGGLLQADEPPAGGLEAACRKLLPQVRELAAGYRSEFIKTNEALAQWLRRRDEPPLNEFDAAPVLLFGKSSEDDLRAYWLGQLRHIGKGLQGIVAGERPSVGEWLYWQDYEDDRAPGLPFFKAEQIRDCIKEAAKLARFLTGPRKTTSLRRGATLFSDNFSSLGAPWKTYGPCEVETSGGRLHISGKGNTLWCERDFGECVVAFDYQPQSSAGGGAGALFAFPATPVAGNGYDISAGPMPRYNLGIDTYHCSLYRGSTGRTNLRRTGPGLKMLSTVHPDACAQLGRNYRVEILKHGASLHVYVDGALIHAYADAGCYGPCLMSGRFGVRHFSAENLESYYGRFEVSKLESGGGA